MRESVARPNVHALPLEWLESTARNERVRRFPFASDAIYECVRANTNPGAKSSSRRRQTARMPAPTQWLVPQWCSASCRLRRPVKSSVVRKKQMNSGRFNQEEKRNVFCVGKELKKNCQGTEESVVFCYWFDWFDSLPRLAVCRSIFSTI